MTLLVLSAAYTVGCLSMIFDAVGVGHCAWLIYFITRNLWFVHIQYLFFVCYTSHHIPISSFICSCKAAEKQDVDTEAPAVVDTKPQIVRVNSGNTPTH